MASMMPSERGARRCGQLSWNALECAVCGFHVVWMQRTSEPPLLGAAVPPDSQVKTQQLCMHRKAGIKIIKDCNRVPLLEPVELLLGRFCTLHFCCRLWAFLVQSRTIAVGSLPHLASNCSQVLSGDPHSPDAVGLSCQSKPDWQCLRSPLMQCLQGHRDSKGAKGNRQKKGPVGGLWWY